MNRHATQERDSSSRRTKSLPELQARLGVSTDGLSDIEVQHRQAQYGYNELPEEKINPLLKFLSYFWGPTHGMIEIAALKSKLALRARVKREGTWVVISARELVPGDVIRLRLGEIVPADANLLDGDPAEVDQSALTGESLPVTRLTGHAVYSGSIIRQGEIEALVSATGKDTYFGKTAHLVETAHTVSHLQKAVLKIGDYLIVIAPSLVLLILAVALFRGDPMLTTLQFALVLTVAAVPVAMPAVLSVTMAVGARLLAVKQAIVRRLASIEELAGKQVVATLISVYGVFRRPSGESGRCSSGVTPWPGSW